MNSNQILEEAKKRMDTVVQRFEEEQKKIRTGRAHPHMLSGVVAEAYGSRMPLIQLATVTSPEPQLLQISPFDPTTIQSIVKAIREDASLGLNPVDDGRVIRIPVPPLTTERRQQIVKALSEKVEECMIGLRQARHEALRAADQSKKDKVMGEDDARRLEKQVDELMGVRKTEVEGLAQAKEKDIMTI